MAGQHLGINAPASPVHLVSQRATGARAAARPKRGKGTRKGDSTMLALGQHLAWVFSAGRGGAVDLSIGRSRFLITPKNARQLAYALLRSAAHAVKQEGGAA